MLTKKGSRLVVNSDSIAQQYSNEAAFYISDELKMNDMLSISYGLRAPLFISGSKAYTFVEPRITGKLSLNETTSLKASYTEMNQFMHLVPNSTASMPTDIWLTSSAKVKPENSKQFALGLFKNFDNNGFETSVEIYYITNQSGIIQRRNSNNLKIKY